MESELELSQLKRDRANIKGKLTRFRNYLNDERNQSDYTQIRARLNKIEGILEQFEVVQHKIEFLSNEQDHEMYDFECSYYEGTTLAVNLLKIETSNAILESVSSNQNVQPINNMLPYATANQNCLRLPRIELKTFDGSFDKWLEFYDTFCSMVHNNANIPNIQKLHYLRSSLRSEAAAVINALETSAENYEVALALLRERFDNRRVILQKHVKALMELPVIFKESASEIRKLIDDVKTHLRALKTLGQNVDTWDAVLIYTITSKIDRTIHKEWEKSINGPVMPSLTELMEFLENRYLVLQSITLNTSNCNASNKQVYNNNKFNHNSSINKFKTQPKSQTLTVLQKTNSCKGCGKQHKLYECDTFYNMSIKQRAEFVKTNQLCFNCFNSGHRNTECKARTCKKCNKRHHTMLHFEPRETNVSLTSNNATNETNEECNDQICEKSVSHLTANCSTLPIQILLSTAIIDVKDKNGKRIQARVLLDSGSQSNFMTQKFVNIINIPRKSINIPIEGINRVATSIKESVNTMIYSRKMKYSTNLEFLIIPYICDRLPNKFINKDQINIPQHIKLADPEYYKPNEIDALLGVEIFYDLLCIGQIRIENHQSRLIKTKLGWILSGRIGAVNKNSNTTPKYFLSLDTIRKDVIKFWEIEEIQNERFLSVEENEVEQYYKETTRRDPCTGRFIVRLPFKTNIVKLGESYEIARRRFFTLEKKLARNPNLHTQYHEFMQEYIKLRHMTCVEQDLENKHYFMPHHAIVKNSSQTTKVRVVFDASAKTNSGLSLNHCLKTGPTIQQDIVSILIRFRTHQYVIAADIQQMYRQILVDERDTFFQQLVYRENENEPLKTYRANTVTYGTTAAPFLAIRSLFQLADDVQQQFPNISNIIKRDFYVDDVLTGADSIRDVIFIRDSLIKILNSASFPLRKWASNNSEIIKPFANVSSIRHILANEGEQKTLGVNWNAKNDHINYSITKSSEVKIIKRTILSNIAQLFDPIGLLGPVIVAAKLVMQSLWKYEAKWDEAVPIDIYTAWTTLKNELPILEQIKFNRKIIIRNAKK